jgi:hypothetical protein
VEDRARRRRCSSGLLVGSSRFSILTSARLTVGVKTAVDRDSKRAQPCQIWNMEPPSGIRLMLLLMAARTLGLAVLEPKEAVSHPYP